MLRLQQFFVSLWHSNDAAAAGTPEVLTYVDRLRIRQPGDARFALGPHADGGSVERWEDPTYRDAYAPVFAGRWREFDAFDMRSRGSRALRMSMYDTAGGCSVFRAWQGWVSGLSLYTACGRLTVPMNALRVAVCSSRCRTRAPEKVRYACCRSRS